MPTETGGTPTGEENSGSAVGGIPTPDAVETGASTPIAQTPVIDWTTFDVNQIPEDVIKKTTPFKQVLGESIERRKEIAALKGQASHTEVKLPEGSDMPEWGKALVKTIEEQNKLLSGIVVERAQTTRQAIATKYGVPANMVSAIAGESDEDFEANAKVLGEALAKSGGGVSGNSSPGNSAGGGDTLTALRARVRAKLDDKGVNTPSIFEPGVQRQTGGGPMSK